MSDSDHSPVHVSDNSPVVVSPEHSDREQSDDALDIKPPQRHAVKKERHKHKHKHKDDRGRGDRKHGDRDRTSRKEDRERDRKQREIEHRSREESLRERERLERLEREKIRDRERLVRTDRERERRVREKDSRRGRPGWRDDRGKLKKAKPSDDRRPKDRYRAERGRSRSPRRTESSQRDRDMSSNRAVEKKVSPKIREIPDTPASPDEDHAPLPEMIHEQAEESEAESGEEEEEEEEASDGSEGEESGSEKSQGSSSQESGEEEEEEEEESESEESEEASGSGAEEEEDGEEKRSKKVKSKFDDHSSEEEEVASEQGSVHQSPKEQPMYLDETPPASPMELKPELPQYFPAIQGCRSVEEFHCLNRIEEGTYGVVYRARDKKTTEIVALKRLKMEKEKEGFPITSLREINTLLKAQHMNIVTVREIVVGSNMDKIYIVMDYVEHDLKGLMESMKQPFLVGEVKTLLRQLLKAVAHLHDNWILHRDLKTSNLLLSHKGILKVGDFGLAREYGSPLKHYTPIVVTLWYRCPELLLGAKEYSTAVDMWSVGCIFAEFLTLKPLWPGKSEIDQLNKIFKDLGTPSDKIWPGVSELPAMKKCTFADYPYNTLRNRFGAYLSDAGFELMNKFLTYNPGRRISAEEALKVDFFNESPHPVDPSMFPTWPAKSEQPRKHQATPKPPSGGKAYALLMGDPDDEAALTASGPGFHMGTAAKGTSAVGVGFSLKF